MDMKDNKKETLTCLGFPHGLRSHLDYAQGYNLTNRMPLFVKPTSPLDVTDAMDLMRTHFEGTWFDTTGKRGMI